MSDLGGYTIRRSYINPDLKHDRFDIHYPDGLVINCGYQTACDFMLNRLDLEELKQSYTKKPGVFLL